MKHLYYIIKSVLVNFLCKITPVKQNRILFNNFGGRGFGDNPRYIAEEIIRQKLPFELLWLTKERTNGFPPEIKQVVMGTAREKLAFATSKIVISNVRHGVRYKKKKNTFFIQTWHADFAPKMVEGECPEFLNAAYTDAAKTNAKITDYALSGSKMFTHIAKQYFWYPENTNIIETGIPRNDIYFNTTEEERTKIKQRLFNDVESKFLIYAPTFRDNGKLDVYNINVENIRSALEKKTGEKWKVIIRLHPHLAGRSDMFQYNENILNGSKFSDPQELFLISDILITDYSSTLSDFMLMHKPVFLYVSDLEDYKDNCRHLRPEYYKLPFPFCKNNEELLNAIESFDNNKYQKELEHFCNTYYSPIDDGHASKRVIELIRQIIDNINYE